MWDLIVSVPDHCLSFYLSEHILSAWSWSSFIPLSGGGIDQLKFWQDHLGKLNFKDIFESHKCKDCVF